MCYCQNQLRKRCVMGALHTLGGFKERDVAVVSAAVDEISREASVKGRLCEDQQGTMGPSRL